MKRNRNKLDYSLVIEATSDPNFFCYYSPNIGGFTGTGKSVEDCIEDARRAIPEHLQIMREEGFPISPKPAHPRIITRGIKPSKSKRRTGTQIGPRTSSTKN